MLHSLFTAEELNRMIVRLAHEMVERFDSLDQFGLIGLQTRGVYLARRIEEHIKALYEQPVAMGVLDITFYRDDIRTKENLPTAKLTDIPFDLSNKHIVIVDDVLFTGRTIRSAMEAIHSFGRPKEIKCCCIVDRGHRELPITPDYFGVKVPTHANERVEVHFSEIDEDDGIFLKN